MNDPTRSRNDWQLDRKVMGDLLESLEWLTGGRNMIKASPLVHVALDCSVTYPERFIAYCGFVASPAVLKAFSQGWEQVLDEFGLPYMRMTDAIGSSGPFAHWLAKWGEDAPARRDKLLRNLADLVRNHGLRVIGGTAETSLGVSSEQRASHRKAVFDAVIEQMIGMSFEEPLPSFAILCDRQQDLHSLFGRWLERLQEQNDAIRSRVAGLCVLNGNQVGSLQAAGMAAHLLRQDAERKAATPESTENPLLERMVGSSVPAIRVSFEDFNEPDRASGAAGGGTLP